MRRYRVTLLVEADVDVDANDTNEAKAIAERTLANEGMTGRVLCMVPLSGNLTKVTPDNGDDAA